MGVPKVVPCCLLKIAHAYYQKKICGCAKGSAVLSTEDSSCISEKDCGCLIHEGSDVLYTEDSFCKLYHRTICGVSFTKAVPLVCKSKLYQMNICGCVIYEGMPCCLLKLTPA